jgi:hypothetical protein
MLELYSRMVIIVSVSSQELLNFMVQWSMEIAAGMEFLSSKNVSFLSKSSIDLERIELANLK